MELHFNLDDAALEAQFRACTLDPDLFSHEAHLRLAWILVSKYGLEQAQVLLCADIARFDRTVGDGSKFHRTITMVAVRVVAHFMERFSGNRFNDFIAQHPRLKSNFKDLVATHYSYNLMDSEKAKQIYIEPDLLPF